MCVCVSVMCVVLYLCVCSLVEDAVAMPTWTPLACPPLPAHPEELHLADLESSSLPIVSPSSLPSLPPSLPPLPPLPLHLSIQWKKFLLVIAFVLTCVLLIHCVICGLYGYLRECGCERVKVHRRMSSLPPVKYARLEYEHVRGRERERGRERGRGRERERSSVDCVPFSVAREMERKWACLYYRTSW